MKIKKAIIALIILRRLKIRALKNLTLLASLNFSEDFSGTPSCNLINISEIISSSSLLTTIASTYRLVILYFNSSSTLSKSLNPVGFPKSLVTFGDVLYVPSTKSKIDCNLC
jgi:hypothetical protein